ncbi:MAG TPA: glycosyltransferase [Longimicrobiales bacterium]|nr:glycosyltransferase [Longimicrobiales bacterium]
MARHIQVDSTRTLKDAEEYAFLAGSIDALRREAEPVAEAMAGRTLWMINSTAQGGGVSEMLPGIICHLRDLGIDARWVVLESTDAGFFRLTKNLHNLLHGEGDPTLGNGDRELYEAVNRENAEALLEHVKDGDVVVVHDPQPMAMAGVLSAHRRDLHTVWRCHIGLDGETQETRAAWSFLEPYHNAYQHAIFSAPEYVAPYFEGRSSIIYPSLDPLATKNRPMPVQEVVAVLERSGLLCEPGPMVLPRFEHVATRLQPDGTFRPAVEPDDLGLLTRPVVTQVSRWDRLKGFLPLMHGFAEFKRGLRDDAPSDEMEARRLALTRLVLAGPDPDSIADDPEGVEVLEELKAAYVALPEDVRVDVALLALPMASLEENALIVNALQRVSTVVVQNSLREGFGLTITEAMWKGVPVLSNSRACGPRQQVRDRLDGRLVPDPEDTAELARALRALLRHPERTERMGRAAQRQVHDHFLVYAQLAHWVRLVGQMTTETKSAA